MSRTDPEYKRFFQWYQRYYILESCRSPHPIPDTISPGDYSRAQVEISTRMFSENTPREYCPYSLEDPRTVARNTALFIDIHRDSIQWQRQWIRYAVNAYNARSATAL